MLINCCVTLLAKADYINVLKFIFQIPLYSKDKNVQEIKETSANSTLALKKLAGYASVAQD
jgi:hypothetical protein